MTKEQLDHFLKVLRQAKWNVATKQDDTLDLNPALLARYPHVPNTYLDFLRRVTECSNPAQTAWFLCAKDFGDEEQGESSFRWDEWERAGLEAAKGDGESTEQVTHFWNTHLPIMSAVHSDYTYLAISLSRSDHGAIIYGYGPEFEESATKVCGSFEELLDIFGRIVADVPLTRSELSDFL